MLSLLWELKFLHRPRNRLYYLFDQGGVVVIQVLWSFFSRLCQDAK